MTTVLAFLLTIGILIVIHEYGHYRMATSKPSATMKAITVNMISPARPSSI